MVDNQSFSTKELSSFIFRSGTFFIADFKAIWCLNAAITVLGYLLTPKMTYGERSKFSWIALFNGLLVIDIL